MTINDIEPGMSVRERKTGLLYTVERITHGYRTSFTGGRRLVKLEGEDRLRKATELDSCDEQSNSNEVIVI